jgi:hypothetical protein
MSFEIVRRSQCWCYKVEVQEDPANACDTSDIEDIAQLGSAGHSHQLELQTEVRRSWPELYAGRTELGDEAGLVELMGFV